MSTIRQKIAHYKRAKAVRLIKERYHRVNRHVYTQAEILPDNTTRVWICVDGVRIMLITDYCTGQGIPHVSTDEAAKYIDFVKRQYYYRNRHKVLRYEQSQR